MSRKIYLSTYVINLQDKEAKENVNLSRLTGGLTFAKLFEEFIYSITKLPFKDKESKRVNRNTSADSVKSLTMKEPFTFQHDEDTGEISGLLSSGISGRRQPMHDIETGKFLYEKKANHAAMMDTFFKVKYFEDRKYALLILERQGEFGIKKLFTAAFKGFLTGKNVGRYNFLLNNFLVGRVFDKMISEARILEVNFTRNVIDHNISAHFDEGYMQVPGSTKTTVTAGRGLSIPLRNLAKRLFTRSRSNDRNGMVRVEGMHDEYDEIDFELEVNGTRKTIHMAHAGRSLPDYDVSENIDFDRNTGEPTLESLNKEADILIGDMIEYYNTRA